jgi:hypothetical protein
MDKASESILQKVNKVLEEDGMQVPELTPEQKLHEYILPGMQSAKATLASLYSYKPKQYSGILGSIKYKILNKLKHVVLNVVERESMRQQKFNELTTKAIEALLEENKMLKEKLDKKKGE